MEEFIAAVDAKRVEVDIEQMCKVFNRTPFAHPMLFRINAAVHANTNYQVIFPPPTEWAAQHSKPELPGEKD